MGSLENQAILVTGASGYIATHIVQQLLEEGYHVRGTVRDLKNEAKVKPLQELCPEAKHPLELVEADLTKEDSWESAVDGCKYVIHTASPFPMGAPTNADDVIKPAVDGTLTVMKACQKARVSRMVLTSSAVAIFGPMTTVEADKSYTEEDWAPDSEKIQDTYARSKMLAEKAAWDFIKELPEEERFELAVMNPTLVLGPVLCGTPSTSIELIKKLLERSMPAVPKMYMPIVDVRDVATSHIKALTTPEAAGNRHILLNSTMWMREVAQIMAKEFKPHGYNVPTINCPNFAVKVASTFNKTAKVALPNLGKSIKMESSRMQEVLGVTPHDVKDTIIEMCYSMIEKGMAKKSKKYKGRKGEAEETPAEEGAEDKKEANGDIKDAANGEVKAASEEATEEKKDEEKEEEKKEEEKTEEPAAAPAEEKKEEETKEATEEETTTAVSSSELVSSETVTSSSTMVVTKTSKTTIVETGTDGVANVTTTESSETTVEKTEE